MAIVNGTSGDDYLVGTGFDDTITGFKGDDTLSGLNGNDTLHGGGGDDALWGDADNDQLFGGDGSDLLFGGTGDDYIDPGDNDFFDWIDADTGNDVIDFTSATSSQAFYNIDHWDLTAGITATINGATNTGTIDKGVNGTTTLTEVVNALSGAGLRLIGTGFDDVFNIDPGDTGEIQVRTSPGNDTVNIGAGTGAVYLDFSNALVGVTVNLATGVVANDGFGDSDTITGTGIATWLYGSDFDDTIRGAGGDDTLWGDAGNDQLFGGGGSDDLIGGDGDDYINPGNNNFFDWIEPGAGNDIVDFTGATGGQSFYNIDHWDLTAGITATINGTTNTGTIDKGVNGTTTLTEAVNALSGFGLRLIGTYFDDIFNINPGDTGEIQVRSSAGDDTINIGSGMGEVYLDFRNAFVGVTVNLGTGVVAKDGFGDSDTVTGTGHVTWVYGSDFDDTIRGSNNDETFSLFGGSDKLIARGGHDVLDFGRGTETDLDTLMVDLQAGTATGTYLGTAFSHMISGIEQVRGSDTNDIIHGSDSQGDTLEGGAGKDKLLGGRGNDLLQGDAGNDNLKGEQGKDRLEGGNGKDRMDGGGGNDRMLGGKGNDRMDGSNGNDKMTGGAGNDRFVFSKGDDVISDFNAANNKEKIDLSSVSSITGFKDLKNHHMTESNGNVVIDDNSGNTLTLNGLTIGDLDKGDFIF